jgi:RNA 3'-terminal phosphate cyclase (ATP)
MVEFELAAGLRLVADICSAQLTGCEIGSTSIEFNPGPTHAGNYIVDPGTAGSTTLLLQVSYPCLVFSRAPIPSQIIARGGTNATQAPQADYTQQIFLPFLRDRFGLNPQLMIRKRGYYPKGGGEVLLQIPAFRGPIPAATVTERGGVKSIVGKAYVAGLPKRMAEQIRAAAVANLVASGVDPSIIQIVAIREAPDDAVGKRSGIILWAETENGYRLGGSSTGLRGESLTSLGNCAAEELARNIAHGGCVDEYLQVHQLENARP